MSINMFDETKYDNIIINHRQASDILWSLKTYHNPLYDDKQQSPCSLNLLKRQQQSSPSTVMSETHYLSLPRKSEQIKQDVLNSLSLKYTIDNLASTNEEKVLLHNEAKHILNEMSHQLNMKSVRVLAYLFSKILNCLYENIYINKENLERVRQLYVYPHLHQRSVITTSSPSTTTFSSTLLSILSSTVSSISPKTVEPTMPIVTIPINFLTPSRILFLPTHRSYMDFIIMTYLAYEYNLPLPCIAAAQDFLGLGRIFSNLLRHCGAFFIRRTFRSDKLYWTIFDEYVKTHLINGDYPLEFFLEGARSRTLKTLLPVRQGMFKSCLECYFQRYIDNLYLIPITITYEKVLEDNLHSYELLGVPKPKESSTGLLKATQILKKNFGTMFVHFNEPIQVRDEYEQFRKQQQSISDENGTMKIAQNVEDELLTKRILRSIQPRFYSPDTVDPFEQKFIDTLSYRVVYEQQKSVTIYPIALLSYSLLSWTMSKPTLINYEQFLNEKSILIDHVLKPFSHHHQIYWSNDEKQKFQEHLIRLYPEMFEKTNRTNENLLLKLTNDRLMNAALLMKLIMYRNTFLHLLAKPLYVLLPFYKQFSSNPNHHNFDNSSTYSIEHLKCYYQFFINLFSYEFVYDCLPSSSMFVTVERDFHTYLNYWLKLNFLIETKDSVSTTYRLNSVYNEQVFYMTSAFVQYSKAYLSIYNHVVINPMQNGKTMTDTAKQYQKEFLNVMNINDIVSVLCSSSNLIQNALRTILNTEKKQENLDKYRQILTLLFDTKSQSNIILAKL